MDQTTNKVQLPITGVNVEEKWCTVLDFAAGTVVMFPYCVLSGKIQGSNDLELGIFERDGDTIYPDLDMLIRDVYGSSTEYLCTDRPSFSIKDPELTGIDFTASTPLAITVKLSGNNVESASITSNPTLIEGSGPSCDYPYLQWVKSIDDYLKGVGNERAIGNAVRHYVNTKNITKTDTNK